MITITRALLLVLVLNPLVPAPTRAQDEKPIIGAGLGVAAGTAITVGVVVARARWGRVYLDSPEDLIHWQSIPMIAAPAVGAFFGLTGDDALKGSIIGSSAGALVGAGVGAGLGWLLSDEQEWPWAGGVIGAALGMSVGGIYGGLTGWRKDHDPDIPFPDFMSVGFSVAVP